MIKVGLTGGIGSGKSTVARLFEILNVPVYYADDRAKWLMNHDLNLIKQIKELFGRSIYANDELDRRQLSTIVFQNPEALHQLNGVVHPAVFADLKKWCDTHSNHRYIVKEAALIYETILHQQLDKIIVVTADEKTRIERVMKRDSITEQQVRARMKNQLPEEEKINRADFLVYNDEQHLLIEQVLAIHAKF